MLNLNWRNGMLRIEDSRPGRDAVRVWYLEAYCRDHSADQDWAKTVIKHTTRIVSQTPQRIELQDHLENGAVADHVISAGADEVTFEITLRNTTDRALDLHWAQPCIRLDEFLRVKEEINSEAYLPKCFVFIDGHLRRLPLEPWSRKGMYTPGQCWHPPLVPDSDVNPRPSSPLRTSNGLIGCYSHDDRFIMATAWEPYQELFQGIFICLHSDPRFGGLAPNETKTARGKIYVVEADVTNLLHRYERDFPEHVKYH
jgi:hypothetical protein